jgi:hypothetical protein
MVEFCKRFIKIEMSPISQGLGNKASIQQMHGGMLRASNIAVHWKPIKSVWIKWTLVIMSIRVTKIIPREMQIPWIPSFAHPGIIFVIPMPIMKRVHLIQIDLTGFQ